MAIETHQFIDILEIYASTKFNGAIDHQIQKPYLTPKEMDKINQYQTMIKHNQVWAICTLQWRHNGHQITSLTIVYSTIYSGADQRKTSELHVTGLCVGNSPGTGEFLAQMASNAENVSIWWRHHDISWDGLCYPRFPGSQQDVSPSFFLYTMGILIPGPVSYLWLIMIPANKKRGFIIWAPSQYKDRLSQVWGFPC